MSIYELYPLRRYDWNERKRRTHTILIKVVLKIVGQETALISKL